MSDFAVFFPASDATPSPTAELNALEASWREAFQIQDVHVVEQRGFGLLTANFREADPIRVYRGDDGYAVVKGVIFDVQSDNPTVGPEKLLREFTQTGQLDRSRYEGAFVAALWDAQRRRGMLLNDQGATLNAFYGEFSQGLYAATRGLPLARVLRLPLAPEGVCDFLARGQLLTPDTMFRGLKRLSFGEQLFYEKGRAAAERYWVPYLPTTYKTISTATEAIGGALVDRVRRYAHDRQPIVCDLTSGYDSRLMVCGCDRAGIDYAMTVNGDDDQREVIISKMVAEKVGRPWIHFNCRNLWDTPVDERMRRELLYRTDGGLVFPEVYHHLLSRPLLARNYPLHFIGGHGDFVRYHPWSHEFWNIGKRRLADIPKLLRYRFLQKGLPSEILFSRRWQPFFTDRLRARVGEVCRLVPDALNTQQLDAIHVWKMTGHFTAYISAVWDWLPSSTPLGSAGFLNAALATSWKVKLTTRLIRQIMCDLSPKIAHVKTQYGGTGAPPTWKTLPRELLQCYRQATHLLDKADRMALKGVCGAPFRKKNTRPSVHVPYLTPEFRSEMSPERFRSRRLYREETLTELLRGSDNAWYANEGMLLRIATLELLCREINFEPDVDFLPNHI